MYIYFTYRNFQKLFLEIKTYPGYPESMELCFVLY